MVQSIVTKQQVVTENSPCKMLETTTKKIRNQRENYIEISDDEKLKDQIDKKEVEKITTK